MILQIVTFIIVMLGWTLYKVRMFLKKNQPVTAGLYGCLMGICTILGSLLAAHIDIPSTTTPLNLLFQPIGKLILNR
ncbi:hypothetical protein P5G65_21220 [Paenibacillus chondroitinus]|uniref:Uncharacterized protein n=1 Tax=Paenibacillus chondroitinus TaxID=59842 RepID=A0ABU6DGD2_9BACL|nr:MULTISPECIES: hypothetical protein [Paenibacillus]MCY9659235.1 hypothetical protein [Paenibacillus anseongense]MEB4796430.1 hypothetical protein [Paenibacillus chondroitinus]